MDDYQNNRIKASMIVFQLEQDLGTYITEHIDSVSQISENIVVKVSSNVACVEDLSLTQLIGKAYLDDIFSVALDISKGHSDNEKLKKLKNLCQTLDLYSIRNAIAHPNKTFSLNYWYKTITIATDPLIEMLGLTNVVTAYRMAMAGTIITPPEEWLNKPLWFLPNNLPEVFDHNITGFLGRYKEKLEIRKLINNKRYSYIAVTGPGGLGKTAIVLELLKEISLDPKSNSIIDAILFISMKTEELTINGIQMIDAVNTIEKLKCKLLSSIQNIFQDEKVMTLEDAVNKYSNKNILLFVDNLETLLRDNPSNFNNFVNSLPASYRVIVSSRIPVDAAVSYPLNQMNDQDASLLARNYARRKSVTNLSEDNILLIVKSLQNNPLAIRLFIDSISASGKNFNEILKDVSGDIAEFSYKNLIESLTEISVEILELLFLQKSLTREEITELIGLDIDDIALGISQLRRTSLLISSQLDGDEKYDINEGIRSFLTLSQRNISIRENLLKKLRKNKAILNEIDTRRRNNLNKNNMWFIPNDIPKDLQKIIYNISKETKKDNNLQEIKNLYSTLINNEKRYRNFDIYWRVKAHILSKLRAIQEAEECLSKAIELNEDAFINNYELAKFYFYSGQDYVASEYLFKKIIENINKFELDNYLTREVYSLYYLSLLYQGKNKKIIESTKTWKEQQIIRGVLGSIRARALKRISENETTKNKFDLLYRAIKIILDTINQDGELKMTKSTINELVTELNFIADNNKLLSQITEKQKLLFDSFLNRYDSTNGNYIYNRFLSPVNDSYSSSLQGKIEQKISEGYKPVSIYKIPTTKWGYTQYLFARSEDGQEYFIHVDNCSNIEWEDWKNLKVDDEALVKPQKSISNTNKAIPTEDVYFI